MNIGEYIRSKRTEKDLSLSELARQSGVAKGYLSSLENGRYENPTLATLAKLASVLGVTIPDMLKGLD